MIACYDIDKNLISPSHHMFLSGTTTTLSQELKNGDTVVHFTNLSGWRTGETLDYRRGFIFWNYKDSKGFEYPAGT